VTAPDEVAGAGDREKMLRTVRTKKDSRELICARTHATARSSDRKDQKQASAESKSESEKKWKEEGGEIDS